MIAQVGTISANHDETIGQDHRRSHGEGRQGRGHHRRRSAHPRDLARARRGHAVRPRLPVALLRHRPRADGRRAREPADSDPREEDPVGDRAAARARARGEAGPAAADHRRRRRGRSAGDARRQQAARDHSCRGGQGPGLWRSPPGDSRGHRGPDRRARGDRRPRRQARERGPRGFRAGEEGHHRQGHDDHHRGRRHDRGHSGAG